MVTLRFAGGLAALCAFAVMLPATAEETPKRGGILNYVIPADAPPSFDAHRETTFATVQSAAPFYSVLIRANPMNPGSAADLVCDLTRPVKVLLHEDDLMAGLDELFCQVIPHLTPADDEHEHDQTSLAGTACEPPGAASVAPPVALDPALAVVAVTALFVKLATIS